MSLATKVQVIDGDNEVIS